MRPRTIAVSCAHLIVTLAIAPPLLAQSVDAKSGATDADRQRALSAWQRGSELFEKGDYQGALAQFFEGHRLSNKGGFLYNMAECERMLGRKQKARVLYVRYLRDYPGGSHRDRAQAQCRALDVGSCDPSVPRAPAVPAPSMPSASPSAGTPTDDTQPASVGEPEPYLPQGAADPAPAEQSTPLYKHWGLWAGVGAAVVAGSITAIVLATSSGGGSLPDADYTVDLRK